MSISEIKTKGVKICVIVLLVFLTGCASNYKDFKVSDVDSDEGIAIGKVKVVYNGVLYTDECRICISSTCHELTSEGFVFMSLDQGTASVEELHCKDGGNQNQSFENTQFKVEQGVNYFGNLVFNWKNSDPSSGASNALGAFGLIGGLVAASIEAPVDGEITITVNDDMPSVLSAYRQQVGNEEAQARKSIITVGSQANP